MTVPTNGRLFAQGFSAGILGSLFGSASVLYILSKSELVTFSHGMLPEPGRWAVWLYANLGWSLPVFALLLLAYGITLGRLRRYLGSDRPIEDIVQLDHLTDTWTTLFFGTGVIWTAIGMRSALIVALGDRDATLQQGAFGVLERLVDGGILLALSTTIFGGVGGYLMRVYKSISIGSQLQQRYDRAARVDTSSMKDALHRIEEHLRGPRADSGDGEQ